uniref:Uncharacterized protein n=1 Tax=Panagrolaimus sp. PS1159 TaxID=55785 RepID=A0AC35FM02_9BILA
MIFYGLTQDCQIFFARPDQLEQLRDFRVQTKVTYCLPNLVQLHWRQFHHHGIDSTQMGLQLLFKRANNQICTLPIEFPSKNALSGFTIFSYSILSSLNYAACSYIQNSTFIMEPDLSFMDTSYSDVIYFADPTSTGSFWNIRQFKFDKNGYFKSLESFIVKNFAEDKLHHSIHVRDYILSLDNQRHKVFAIQRHNKKVTSTCAYDLLFRPSKLKVTFDDPLHDDSTQFRVNSFAAEGNHLLIGNSFRKNHDEFSTKLMLTEKGKNSSKECLLEIPFLAELSFISMETKEVLEKIHLPHFGHHKTHKHHQITNNSSRNTKTSSTKETFKSNFGTTKKLTTTTPSSPLKTTTKPITTTTPSTAGNNNDLLDVGDGRIIGKGEENQKSRGNEFSERKIDNNNEEEENNGEGEEEEELGLMTEITTKNILEDEIVDTLEGSGSGSDEMPFSVANETSPENLSSFANSHILKFNNFPVILVFIILVL